MKTEKEVNDIGAARDQGLEEISKLQKELDNARNEIVVFKKAVGQGSIGGVAHVKVKEPESYDGMRGVKALGNLLWDIEQYLEHLDILDDEAKVKVVAQFLMKDAKMWWQRKMDQIANGEAVEISS